jgi:uncharacterized spore protein YtfJ
LRPPRAGTYGSEVDIQELLSKVTDNLTVGRVFGEPVQHGDIVVVPVARIRGGAGGGNGTGATDDLSNSGGGGGFEATPVGVFVLKNGSAQWHPALDVTRIAIGGQVVAVVLALVLRSILRRR